MEPMMQSLGAQLLTHIIVPMFGSMLVILGAFMVALAPVRNRVVHQLGAYAAMLTWLGWMAHVYKVV